MKFMTTDERSLLQDKCSASAGISFNGPATVASTFDMSTPNHSPLAKASSPPVHEMDLSEDALLLDAMTARASLSETFDIRTPPDGEQDHFIGSSEGSPESSEGSPRRHDSEDPWSACTDWASLNVESSSSAISGGGKLEKHVVNRLQQKGELQEEANVNKELPPCVDLAASMSLTAKPENHQVHALQQREELKEAQLAEQASKEIAAKTIRRQNAVNSLQDWSEQRAASIQKRHIANRALQQTADKHFANPWEHVMELIDSTAQPAVERGRDTSRMLALLIQLKNSSGVRT